MADQECATVLSVLRHGLTVHSVFLSVLLIVGTAAAVALVSVRALDRQIEASADRRLMDGATLFTVSLQDTRRDLDAAGEWLTRDAGFRAAIQSVDTAELQDLLNTAVQFSAVDEIVVVGPAGAALATRRIGAPAAPGGRLDDSEGYRRALAGFKSGGPERGSDGMLRVAVYVPVVTDQGHQIGVARLSSDLDQSTLDRFRGWTGLDAGLFYGGEQVLSTLRRSDGAPLTDGEADQAAFDEVMVTGSPVLTWRELPIGAVRTYFVPFNGAGGSPIGMVTVGLPRSALTGEFHDALLTVLPVVALITLAGAILTFLLIQRLRSPVQALAGAAVRLRAGDLYTPIPRVKEPELEPLAVELEHARASMQARFRAVVDEEERLRAVFSALRYPTIAVDADGRIVATNLAAERFFHERAPLLGHGIDEILPDLGTPMSRDARSATWQRTLSGAGGGPRDLEITATSLPGDHGAVASVYVFYDVSHYAEIGRMREHLLYTFAHELRGPLTVLENALGALDSEYATLSAEEFGRLAGSAHRTAVRLRRLMEDLLSAGSIQAGRLTVDPQPIAVAALIDDALAAIEAESGGRRQPIERDRTNERTIVLADRRFSVQVITNLLSNAVKYSEGDSVIRITVEPRGDVVRLAVTDSGPGIPAERQAEIFQPFARIPTGTRETGSGLGLTIAKGIAEAHGGEIGIDSEEGHGTSVWFTLPRAGGRDEDPGCGG
jgi:signal transduction histidine kinase